MSYVHRKGSLAPYPTRGPRIKGVWGRRICNACAGTSTCILSMWVLESKKRQLGISRQLSIDLVVLAFFHAVTLLLLLFCVRVWGVAGT